jgi:hypothetical protein
MLKKTLAEPLRSFLWVCSGNFNYVHCFDVDEGGEYQLKGKAIFKEEFVISGREIANYYRNESLINLFLVEAACTTRYITEADLVLLK